MRAINSDVMKEMNRKMVLDYIRRSPISRAELADATKLTRASITQIIDGLMRDGLVKETTPVERNAPGRRQMQLELVKDSMCVAGIYCGRNHFDIGIVDLGGRVLWSTRGQYCDKEISEIMDEVVEKLKSAMENLPGRPEKIYGLGICLPSPVEKKFAEVIRKPGFWQQRNIRFAEDLRQRLGWDVFIGNASNAHALDELYFGIGMKGAENFMVLRVDESVGAGFIINRKLFRGARGFSPEIGHITLERNGPKCICGNRGCLELYLAPPHILKDTPFESWRDLVDKLGENPLARELYNAETETLAFEIMNLANVMDLDKVVLTGDLVYGGEKLCGDIMAFMDKNFVHRLDPDSVVPGSEVNIARVACMPAFLSIFA